VLFFVKEDENCAYIENFEEFVRVHYHFLNIEGKVKKLSNFRGVKCIIFPTFFAFFFWNC
jgi:hypothetical protein